MSNDQRPRASRQPADSKPKYTIYRSRPRLFARGSDEPELEELRKERAAKSKGAGSQRPKRTAAQPGSARKQPQPQPQNAADSRYRTKSRREVNVHPKPAQKNKRARRANDHHPRKRRRIRPRRIIRYTLLALFAWTFGSFLLFLVSAQIQSSKMSDQVSSALSSGGFPLTKPKRVENTKHWGSDIFSV